MYRYCKLNISKIITSDTNDGSYQDTFANNQKLLVSGGYLKNCDPYIIANIIYTAVIERKYEIR